MDQKKFVRVWMQSLKHKGGVPMAAAGMRISVARASATANYLRKRGVKLPHMPRVAPIRTGYTVDELNELIDNLQ